MRELREGVYYHYVNGTVRPMHNVYSLSIGGRGGGSAPPVKEGGVSLKEQHEHCGREGECYVFGPSLPVPHLPEQHIIPNI